MADYRSMFDRDYVGAWDLGGKDHVVQIARVKAGELTAQGGRKSKKPIIWFEGREKGLVLNKTNAKAIAGLYGNDTEQWIGKRITIYPTTTHMGSEVVDCIRVRPTAPQEPARGRGKSEQSSLPTDGGAS